MKVAALDLGTNTFLMLVAEVNGGRIEKIYRDEIEVTRLGQGVHHARAFHPEALERADACFKTFRRILDFEKVERVVAVATSAARDVANRDEFFAIGRRHGIPITVIPGPMEAELTFLGSTFDLAETRGLGVVDVGGGSTEIIGQEASGAIRGHSFDVGSVRLSEVFLPHHPVGERELEALRGHVEDVFNAGAAHLPREPIRELIAVAGTPTTLAAVVQSRAFSEDLVQGYVLDRETLENWLMRLARMSVEERQKLPGMDPKRADVIVAGTAILLGAMKAVGVGSIRVSVRGVRFGAALAWERLLGVVR